MKKILAFAGSNSSTSINFQLLQHVAKRLAGHDIKTQDFSQYELPLYSADREREKGIPVSVKIINRIIQEHDALLLAVNEHNGNVSAYFKNMIDWLSRLDRNFLANKRILLISTSPGRRGAASALEYTKGILPRFGGEVIESFSLPSFQDNFKNGKILNEVLDMGIEDVLTTFSHQLKSDKYS
ncbi:NAD(P)H-dependent oxidoreductase [Salegentibacter maritimus]|uniref:NAD(P)H-dependent oxidoreductase n=1 Tax=Salegentibacter maritimus TaxID=2794347 RepID=A0ABS0TF37_9FLAO|nr:NAD(P)H-dependent oxidoreductase [Salegentibacter maritimus]MBI6119656.1 NAD(P)H-dependent oxidoreductase [Salegentibacter maritimus]